MALVVRSGERAVHPRMLSWSLSRVTIASATCSQPGESAPVSIGRGRRRFADNDREDELIVGEIAVGSRRLDRSSRDAGGPACPAPPSLVGLGSVARRCLAEALPPRTFVGPG